MQIRRPRPKLSAAAAFLAISLSSYATAGHAQNLVVGLDFTSNPYIIAQPDGTVTGFNVDLVNEVAARLGRPGVDLIDQQFAGIFAGLEAGKYEFIAAPVT